MKYRLLIATILLIGINLYADESDWQSEDNWDNEVKSEVEQDNDVFKEMEIKNRSKKEYKNHIYKYINNKDYTVKNNNVEIATVELNDDLKSDDITVNVLTEDLKVEGDAYRGDSIDIKRNNYKHFVKHDERPTHKRNKENLYGDIDSDTDEMTTSTVIEPNDPLYEKVPEDDVSELEVIDLRDKPKIKDVNIYIRDVTIRVDDDEQDDK